MKKIMKTLRTLFIFTLILYSTIVSVYAQTKGVEDETIIVVKPYQATLSDAFKISETPVRDTSVIIVSELKYVINSAKAETEYTVPEIKPVKIKDEPIPKLYRSYLKGGVGNYATRYGEFFYNSIRSKNYSAGAHIKHISSQGKIKDVGSPFYSENFIKGYGERFFNNSTLSGEMSFDRDVVNYYGYDLNLIDDTTFSILKRKQRFDYFDVAVRYKNNTLKKDQFDYNAGIKFYTLKDKYENIERNFLFDLSGGTNVNQFYLGVNTEIDVTNLSDQGDNYKNNIFSIVPYASTKIEALDISAGVRFTGISLGHGTKFRFHPDINASFKLVENYLIVFAEVTGKMHKNNFRTLTQLNPFYQPNIINGINQEPVIFNSMAANSETKIDFTTGLKGTFSNSMSYNTWINYKSINDLPLFVNNYNEIIANTFILNYDDVNVLNLHGEIGFHQTEKIRFIAKGDFYKYTMTAEEFPWHYPTSEITLTSTYNLADKIILKGDIFYVGKRYAKNILDENLNPLKPIELKGYLDLNLGVDYRYTKILSFFFNLNNIGAAKYQYWNNYPAQRFNILGGLTFAF
ncbi:MAG: hypothetical protein ACR2GN_06710 [Bacteroidia bacterium]